MSEIDDLLRAFEGQLEEPWKINLVGEEKVWMLTYRPESERRLRHRLERFRTVTESAGLRWQLIDVTNSLEESLGGHEYRDEYLRDPAALQSGVRHQLADGLISRVDAQLREADSQTVSALLGAGSLFGLIPISRLIQTVAKNIPGRMLVFFPGSRDGGSYRLLNVANGDGRL